MFPKTLLICGYTVRESVPRYSQVEKKNKQTKQIKAKQNKIRTSKQQQQQQQQKNRQAKMTVVQRSEKQSLYDAELDICSTKMHAQTSLFVPLTDTKKARHFDSINKKHNP